MRCPSCGSILTNAGTCAICHSMARLGQARQTPAQPNPAYGQQPPVPAAQPVGATHPPAGYPAQPYHAPGYPQRAQATQPPPAVTVARTLPSGPSSATTERRKTDLERWTQVCIVWALAAAAMGSGIWALSVRRAALDRAAAASPSSNVEQHGPALAPEPSVPAPTTPAFEPPPDLTPAPIPQPAPVFPPTPSVVIAPPFRAPRSVLPPNDTMSQMQERQRQMQERQQQLQQEAQNRMEESRMRMEAQMRYQQERMRQNMEQVREQQQQALDRMRSGPAGYAPGPGYGASPFSGATPPGVPSPGGSPGAFGGPPR